jgi:hypothetical protein
MRVFLSGCAPGYLCTPALAHRLRLPPWKESAYGQEMSTRGGRRRSTTPTVACCGTLNRAGGRSWRRAGWKDDFGLGHGHAMAMYGTIRPANTPPVTADEAVAGHFAGRRAGWQQTCDQLMAKIGKFGPDVSIQPAKSYLSLVRASKKFAIIQVTAERFDVGIKLTGAAATDRLTESGRWNAMVTHRVRIAGPAEINTELLRWLRSAYDKA